MADGLPVVLTSRCPAGAASGAYAFPGGGATWLRAGALPAGHLGGPKARIALALGIGAGLDRDGLARLLADPEPIHDPEHFWASFAPALR
jgi:L-asparaginase